MVLVGLARGHVRANESDVLVRFDDSVGVTPILSFAPPQNVDLTFADVNGDFRIDDALTSVPTECPAPVLLIRGHNNGAWIAAALPKNVAS